MHYAYKNVKFFKIGTPKGIRTPNLLIRSQMLYPVELWAQDECFFIKQIHYNINIEKNQ
jgi:hypothetical protein